MPCCSSGAKSFSRRLENALGNSELTEPQKALLRETYAFVRQQTQHSGTHLMRAAEPLADLALARRECRRMTQRHAKTFYFASGLLPRAKRGGCLRGLRVLSLR